MEQDKNKLDPIIDLKKVTVVPKTKPKNKPCLLKIDSFQVSAGETVFIKGENDSGKTVLLRTIQWLQKSSPTRASYPPKKKRKKNENCIFIGVEPAVFKDISVMKNIVIALAKKNLRIRHKVLELLHTFELDIVRDERADVLSKSQLLKIEIIRAMTLIPTVLLIDDCDLLTQYDDAEIFSPLIETVIANDGCVIAAGKKLVGGFHSIYEVTGRTVSRL